jgi:hypothetical protein
MNDIIDKINQIDDAIEADPLHSELSILDWFLYQVCSNEIRKVVILNKIKKKKVGVLW